MDMAITTNHAIVLFVPPTYPVGDIIAGFALGILSGGTG